MASSSTRKCCTVMFHFPPTPIPPCIQVQLDNIPLDNNFWTADPGIISPMLNKEEVWRKGPATALQNIHIADDRRTPARAC